MTTCFHETSGVRCILDQGHEDQYHVGPGGHFTWSDRFSDNLASVKEDTRVPLDSEQVDWYAPEHGKTIGYITRNELNEVRSFINDWLEYDNHGFRIPGDAWGRELLECVRTLYHATDPSDNYVILERVEPLAGQKIVDI